jgi:hypothetical protein
VRSDGGAVAVRGGKLRALLAVLALHANRPLTVDRLAVALWGEDAPPTAAKAVQVYVFRLRRALGDASVLETTPGGYRLVAGAEDLDRLAPAGRCGSLTVMGVSPARVACRRRALARTLDSARGRVAWRVSREVQATRASGVESR